MDPKQHPLAFLFLISMPKAATRAAINTASARAANSALAIERFRNANNNALPASLKELVPEFLSGVPIDPFDGKPIRFKKLSPAGYVVYSVGPNLKDDDGTPHPPGSPRSGNYDLTFSVKR